MSNFIKDFPSIKKNKTNQKQSEEDLKPKKKSKSQIKYVKNPDIITQAKPLYLNNLLLPLNPHLNSLTPTNVSNNLLENKEPLLPLKEKEFQDKKTLILDLDETLVHSSFTPFEKNDIILDVDFEGVIFNIYVLVRPFAKEFLINISKYFELVIFTASISKYALPLLDILDVERKIKYRLYREHCTFLNGIYIKDLKRLNRPLKDLIIVDNSPLAYIFNEENGLPIKTWYDDPQDNELMKILPLLIFLSSVDDVRKYIHYFVEDNDIKYTEVNEYIQRYENNKNNYNQKDEQKNKENNDIINKNENSLFNDYKIKTSNIQKNIKEKFCFNNIKNNKDNNKINSYSQRNINQSDNEKAEKILVPIENINSIKQRNTSINHSKDDKNDFENNKNKNEKIGILLKKQPNKKKNLFRLNNKVIEPLYNIKPLKINNENSKNSQKNLFNNYQNNLKNLILPFSNTTKNILFPKSIINNNPILNNNDKINISPIHITKNELIDNNTKRKYTNLFEKIEKKSKNSFSFKNEDNIKISFSNSNNKELIQKDKNNKNLIRYKYLQIPKSNSINNILKFNNLANNININNNFAKTPNKHLMNIFLKEKDSNQNIGYNRRTEKANKLYKLIKGIATPNINGIKNVAYSANPNSIRNHSKNSKKK